MAFFACVIVAGWLVIMYDQQQDNFPNKQQHRYITVCMSHCTALEQQSNALSYSITLSLSKSLIHLVNLLIQIGFFESVHLNQEIQRKDLQFIRFINQNCSQTNYSGDGHIHDS